MTRMIVIAVFCGFVMDLWMGDPEWITHPVILMGRLITFLEDKLRKSLPKNQKGQLVGGVLVAIILPLVTIFIAGGAVYLAGRIHPVLAFSLQVFWSWQVLAIKGLQVESSKVQSALEQGDLSNARVAVSRIVGRDTQMLSAAGVTRAAVETVAENFSDGVTAPLCFLMLGGAPFGLCYKAINTMDSMIGYKNDKYLYFGKTAARIDDICNYIPSRLSALLLIGASGLCGEALMGSWKIWRRDRRCHASPNSAQTEAAVAGALGIMLAGDAYYFGKLHSKPTIGDPIREVEPEDIARTNRMMVVASVLALLLLGGIRVLVIVIRGSLG